MAMMSFRLLSKVRRGNQGARAWSSCPGVASPHFAV